MPISDKTRKLLWGRSGNLCAICRNPLTADKTNGDEPSILGQECHIVSGAPRGPRFDQSYPEDLIDSIDNLILLCPTHHKQVDDQPIKYSATELLRLKASHEKWVERNLGAGVEASSFKIRRIKGNIPRYLHRLRAGNVVIGTAHPLAGLYKYYPEDLSDDEIDLVGGFFQDVMDWNDIYDELPATNQMRAQKAVTDLIAELEDRGLLVFADTEMQRVEGTRLGTSNWTMLHLSVVRESDPNILPTIDADTILSILEQAESKDLSGDQKVDRARTE